MDFLDPKKKRAHRIRLYVGYGLMAVALAIATIILLFAAYGYDIDRSTGGIIQNGLVILDAHPESATIYANGEKKGTTANRLALPAGQYKIELKRDGYRTWAHTVNLEGSSIEQLIYPFLFPEQLASKALQTYPAAPQVATESPDRHWLVVSQSAAAGSFQVFDLNNTKNPSTIIKLPADTITAQPGAQSYEAVEWSSDNVHVLLKHVYQGGSEFVVLDRENPTNSVNITKLFASTAFTTASLRDKKPDQFYLFTSDGSLFSAETKNKAPTLVVQRVAQYKAYQADTLLYALTPKSTDMLTEIHYRRGADDYVLRTVPKAETYLLDMADFNSHFYVAAGSTADGHTYIYKDPLDAYTHQPARTPQPIRVLIANGSQYVSFSAIARFIAVQAGSSFAVYDAETGRQFKYDAKLTLVPGQKATWMDGHRLLLNSGDAQFVFDFDGTNIQKLNPALHGYTPFFDRDYTAMFILAPQNNAADKPVLQRLELKVLPKNNQ
jgi:hypothetical protein